MRDVHGIDELWDGVTVIVIAGMAHAWATVYPFITGTTALLGLLLAGHGVYRLIWRWRHGLPTLYDPEHERPPK